MQKDNPLITSLQNCLAACEYCASACLDEGKMSSMTECIKTDHDCADICATTIRLLLRDSDQKMTMVELCATICAKCAEECEKHDHDHCIQCAKACRKCEKQCEKYLI
jgi:hypothetical protein